MEIFAGYMLLSHLTRLMSGLAMCWLTEPKRSSHDGNGAFKGVGAEITFRSQNIKIDAVF